jgi:hypothetical protein
MRLQIDANREGGVEDDLINGTSPVALGGSDGLHGVFSGD